MGSNLTEVSLQRAVRCISLLDATCKNYDAVTNIPVNTSAHSSKSDAGDISMVVSLVLRQNLLKKMAPRHHQSFPNIKLDPLFNLNRIKTKTWIKEKKHHALSDSCTHSLLTVTVVVVLLWGRGWAPTLVSGEPLQNSSEPKLDWCCCRINSKRQLPWHCMPFRHACLPAVTSCLCCLAGAVVEVVLLAGSGGGGSLSLAVLWERLKCEGEQGVGQGVWLIA